MGVVELDGYVLIVRGKDASAFINGLSTNKIEGTCTTVFTNSIAKIIDMVDVIDMGSFSALVGHGPNKDALLSHLIPRILGQDVQIADASESNVVLLSTEDLDVENGVTKVQTFRGWLVISPHGKEPGVTMSDSEFTDWRVENMIPHPGFEITNANHPYACGLGLLVHEDKGCYIGQEILARMKSRGRQGKELTREKNPVNDATSIGSTHSLVIRRC